MRLCLVERADAAIQYDFERGVIALQPIDTLIVQWRNAAVILGREAFEPGLARVNDERGAACASDLSSETIEPFLLILFVNADAAFDRHRNRYGSTHGDEAFGDVIGLGHETSAEAALLQAVGWTTAVQVDLAIAIVLADAAGERQFARVGAAELQGDRLFDGTNKRKLIPAVELHRGRGKHFRIEMRPAREGAVEGTAMPVRPVHHRGNAEGFLFCFQQLIGPNG